MSLDIVEAKQNSVDKPFKCENDGCTETVCRHSGFAKNEELCTEKTRTRKRPREGNEEGKNKKPYKCEESDCNAAFTAPNRLQKHTLIHHCGLKLFKCDYEGCGKSYRKDSRLKKHKSKSHFFKENKRKFVFEQHTARAHAEHDDNLRPNVIRKPNDKKRHICDEPGCKAAFNRPWRLKNHKQTAHSGKKSFRCEEPDCDAAFTGPNRLQAHKLIHHCEEKPFKCDYKGCGKSYRLDAHLKRHKVTSHSFGRDTEETRVAICEIKGCGKVYCNKYSLNQHMASTHAEHEDDFRPSGCKRPSDIEKRHICDEPGCTASFNRPYRLKNHKLTAHGDERPFKCDFEDCDKSYTNESHLARHRTISHNPEEMGAAKEVICEMDGCGRIFANKYSLKKHIAKSHTQFPFPCQDCDEKFKRRNQLHAHKVEVHEKEAPYKCDKCPKTFVQYHLYNKHLKNHKTYQCDCEKTFGKWTQFLKHRRTECSVKKQEHKCAICEKTFAFKQTLTQHSLHVHIPDSQVDLLKCPYLNCNRSYKYKNGLNYHIRRYHEKLVQSQEVKCPEKNCEVVLQSNKNLKQHLRIVHNGQPAKIRKPRKPRKDKGLPKKSMASRLSGAKVPLVENYRNIVSTMDDDLRKKILNVVPLDEDEGREIVDTLNERPKDVIKDLKICITKYTANATDKQVEENTKKSSQSTSDFGESCTLSSDIASSKENGENPHETTSFSIVSMDIDSECSRHPNDIEVKSKEAECKANKTCENANEEIVNNENKAPYTTEISTTNSVSGVDMDVDNETSKNPIILNVPSSDDALYLNMDSDLFISSQNSVDSGVVIFDFPEIENFNHSDDTESNEVTILEQNKTVVEQTGTKNNERCDSDNSILDKQELKKRLGVMLKDVFAVLKHLENNVK